MMDDDDEDHRNQSSFISQYPKDQKLMSTIETDNFEQISNSASNRCRPRVKFAYSFDKDQDLPIIQTTIIKNEPCFQVTAIEDHVIKDFYQNKTKQDEKTHLMEQSTSFESDSLEDEHSLLSQKNQSTSSQINNTESISPPIKSILKKPKTREGEQITVASTFKSDRSSKSRSPSPCLSSSKKTISTTRLDFNEVEHLAEITAKQNLSSSSLYCRSLFDQTINIFNPNYFHEYRSNSSRPSRFHHYIKPYRGDPPASTKTIKNRSSSLPKPSERISRWENFSNSNDQSLIKKAYRKQHVSWSPTRDSTIRSSTKENEQFSSKTNSVTLLTNPSIESSRSIFPVSIHNRLSRFSSSILPINSSNIPSCSNGEKEESQLKLHRSSQQKKEHDETMKRYDQLLERIRKTDEQLHLLSQSWMKNTRERKPVSNNDFSYDEIFRIYEKEFFRWLISGRSQSKNEFDVE